jgi:hypothetical protein
MFFGALEKGQYECYLEPDTCIPAIYIDDCINASLGLVGADRSKLNRCVYNLGGTSMYPRAIEEEVKKMIPGTKVTYKVDPLR